MYNFHTQREKHTKRKRKNKEERLFREHNLARSTNKDAKPVPSVTKYFVIQESNDAGKKHMK
jgi:hypothetical protein